MIIAGLLISLVAAPSDSVALWRGLPVQDQVGYWAVQDTFLDASSPDTNYGGDPLLSGGPGKAILIRFSDLARMVPANHQVSEARLELKPILGGRPLPTSTALIIRPWMEGPDRRGPKVNPVLPPKDAKSIQGAATHLQALGGLPGVSWSLAGARGVPDAVPITPTSRYADDGTLVIEGLGEWLQRHLTRPDESYGIRIEFNQVVDFGSSEFPDLSARPRLAFRTAPIAAAGPDLRIHHLVKSGEEWSAEIASSASGRARATWVVDGEALPGQEVELGPEPREIKLPARPKAQSITLRLESAAVDPVPSNNVRTSTGAAIPVNLLVKPNSMSLEAFRKLAGLVEQTLNENVLPHSRFSFAPSGSRARIRIEGVSIADPAEVRLKPNARFVNINAGAPQKQAIQAALQAAGLPDFSSRTESPRDVDPFRGMMGWGDTRNDIDLPTILGFLREPWFDPLLSAIPAPATDLLSATDVAFLNARTQTPESDRINLLPKAVILRCLDATGRLIPQATIRMVGMDDVEVRDGLARLPESFKWESNVYGVQITGPTGQASVTLKKWQLVDAFARGNNDTAILTMRFNLPVVPPNRDVNLALNRLAFLPAQIQQSATSLTDGDLSTGAVWPAKQDGTLEIDLGKDRSIAAITLVLNSPNLWQGFQVLASETGESGNPETWIIEPFGGTAMVYRAVQESGKWKLNLYGLPSRARSLKLVVRQPANEPVLLQEVQVFGVKEN